jgi:hypothetical protein
MPDVWRVRSTCTGAVRAVEWGRPATASNPEMTEIENEREGRPVKNETCMVQGCKNPPTHPCDAPGCSNATCDTHTAWHIDSGDGETPANGLDGRQPEGFCPRHVYLSRL